MTILTKKHMMFEIVLSAFWPGFILCALMLATLHEMLQFMPFSHKYFNVGGRDDYLFFFLI